MCLLSGAPISPDYIKSEGLSGRMGKRLMAVIADSERGRVYLPPTPEIEKVAMQAKPGWEPEGSIVPDARAFTPTLYGLNKWSTLFTNRQLLALTTFSDLILDAREQVKNDALSVGMFNDGKGLSAEGTGASAYSDAISIFLSFGCDYAANYWSTLATPADGFIRGTFAMQALQMSWDFAEAPPFGDTSGNWVAGIEWASKAIMMLPGFTSGHAAQCDAAHQELSRDKVISTDPPYYDNVPYADLSDYFYVWLRRPLRQVLPGLFATVTVPKSEELVAFSYRHENSKTKAEIFFLKGMTQAMRRLSAQAHPAFPVTIYYAFRQSENSNAGVSSTGWETFLQAVIDAGFAISGTWPMRTERGARNRSIDSNALASSIILVCSQRAEDASATTRRDFISSLKSELPIALKFLQRGNIAPVDLAQAAIGPGMSVYTRSSKVLDAEGKPLQVREALALINQILDESLAEQEGDFDTDTRWALAWFEQLGFDEGEYGVAETLSKAKDTSVNGMVEAGILKSGKGKVRLLRPSELSSSWDPKTDTRLTVWEMVHHLIRVLETNGEGAAAELAARLGSKAETARELCYRLYSLSERKKRAQEALSYNALVQSWPEIIRLARAGEKPQTKQAEMFQQE